MKRILAFCLFATVIACSKDKFQTTPQLKIKSTNPEIVPVNGTFTVVLEFTDKEGDVNDSLIIVRERRNIKSPIFAATIETKIPNFPNTSSGEIQVEMPYQTSQTALIAGIPAIPIPGTGDPSLKEIDTIRLKFLVRDRAGNKSDTVSTTVEVLRQ